MKNTRVKLAMAAAGLLGGALSVTAVAAPQAHAAACTGVPVTTASNVQTVINGNPGGTTFCFASGTYTGVSSVVPKAGDVLDGNSLGAVLDGGNTRQYAFTDGGTGNAGTDDGAGNVTVQGFKIQNYATPLQQGVIEARSGNAWIIQNNDIEGNAAAAVATGDNVQVLSNTLSNNQEEGFSAQGTGGLYQGNTISGNDSAINTGGPCGCTWGTWEAGGGKAWRSTNLTLKNNTVNNNGGPGLWADTSNLNTTYTGNTVDNNWGPGIYEEISYNFSVTGNDVENNGTATSQGGGENNGYAWDAGIQVRASQGCTTQCTSAANGYGNSVISGNKVVNNYNGITLVDSPDNGASDCGTTGGEGTYGACKVQHVTVQNNGVTMAQGATGGYDDGTGNVVFNGTNTFSGDNYCVATASPPNGMPSYGWLAWGPSVDWPSFSQWQGFGNDTAGTFTVTSSVCAVPGQQAPAVTTTAATGVTSTGATLNGTVNPEGQSATYQFQYGTTTAYGSVSPATPGSAGSGTTAVNESASLTGLAASTVYHYRLTATNGTGTTNGADQQFTTSAGGGTSVAYDSTGPSSTGAKCGTCTSLSWTHTVGSSGTNRALLVGVAVARNPDTSCTLTVKDGTTTLSRLSGPVHSGGSTHGFLSVYDMVNPPAGANSLTATVSGCSSSGLTITAGSESFTGVSQAAAFGTPVTATGVNTSPSATVASHASDMVAGFAVNGSSITSSANTSRYIANHDNNTTSGNSAGATAASTGSNVTMSWAVSPDSWGVIVVEALHG